MRSWLIPIFACALLWSYANGQRELPSVRQMTTEEGQQVVFDDGSFRARELAKRLPLDEAWPAGRTLRTTFERFGLTKELPKRVYPSRIAGDIYLIGQDRVGNNTYMVDCGPEGVAIIDPTYESEFELTVANVEKCGRRKQDIRWVLNTHCHVDHAMADKKFSELGAEIFVHIADADAVEKGSQITGYFLIPGIKEFPPCPVKRRMSDGEELRLGNQRIGVIHTPGHTPGSACFRIETGGKNVLFSGDTVLYDGRLGWQMNPYADNRQYLVSVEKLAEFTWNGKPVRWDLMLPGHGVLAMDMAYLDVQKARELIQDNLSQGKPILASPTSTPEYRKKMFGRPAIAF